MATRKVKKIEVHSLVKALNPRDADTKYLGEEPLFAEQPISEYRNSALARALSWYNRFYNRKDARDMMATYLDMHERTADAKILRKVSDQEFVLPTFAWLSRMTLRGLELTEHESMTMENEISRLIATVNKPEVKIHSQIGGPAKQTKEETESTKKNVQEIMREKAREAAGELEGMLDEFHLAGSPTKHLYRPIDEVSKKNVLPQHISMLTEVWNKKLNEMENVLLGKDSQLVDGYSHYSKHQLKNTVKFIELVLSDLNSYISIKKSAKAPRARKAIPVEKIVSKLKYLRVFKDAATKLDLISISPVKLHGSSEAWVYDTAKRKLHHFVADEYSKTFTVKGNTLLGFDTAQSEVKTLRKPAEQLNEITGSKPIARKFFKDIKAVSTVPNGRFNSSMIILKAF